MRLTHRCQTEYLDYTSCLAVRRLEHLSCKCQGTNCFHGCQWLRWSFFHSIFHTPSEFRPHMDTQCCNSSIHLVQQNFTFLSHKGFHTQYLLNLKLFFQLLIQLPLFYSLGPTHQFLRASLPLLQAQVPWTLLSRMFFLSISWGTII